MIKVLISGSNGRMGRVVADICENDPQMEVVAGFDILGQADHSFPIFSNPILCTIQADVIIDFSSPSALPTLLEYGKYTHTPLVLATTGYDQEQLEKIREASFALPIFRSANMSFGVNVLLDLVKRASSLLGEDFDIEIVERHHNRKVDAPSGTALMIADAAAASLPYSPDYVYQRQSVHHPRGRNEIGLFAVRGGTIVGDHTIIFAGRDEVIEITHHAASREVFASGAVKAAKFLAKASSPGLYDMSSLVD